MHISRWNASKAGRILYRLLKNACTFDKRNKCVAILHVQNTHGCGTKTRNSCKWNQWHDVINGSWGFLLHILRRRQVRFSTSGYCKAKVAVKPGKAEHVFFSNTLFRGQLGSQLWPYANLLHVRSSLVLPVAIPKYYVCQILQEMTPVWSWEITLLVWQADSSLSKGHVSRKHPQLLRIDVILYLEIKTKHTTWHPDLLQPRIASTELVSKACPIRP